MTEDVKERNAEETAREATEKAREAAKAAEGRAPVVREAAAPARPAYLHPFEEMERLFETLTGRAWPGSLLREWPSWGRMTAPFEGRTPKVDLIDRDNELVLRAELPGVKKDDVEVTLSEDSLTIRARTRREEKEEKENFLRQEISYGEFVRTVPLPSAVDVDKASSKFEDGILEIHMPKVEKAKRRVIPVQ